MGFRITTNMMMSTYRYNLMNSTNKLSDSIEKVQTKRNFNSYAEDPTAATQAFRLRRDWYQTQNQISNTKDVYSKFNTAWNNLQGMLKDLINPMDKVSIIRGESDTAGESRTALAQVLRESAESMIQGFNQQLGDHFIFAGNDGLRVPFEWKGETLYYRGIDVTSGGVKEPTAAEPAWLSDWETALQGGLDAGTVSQDHYDEGMAWIKYYRRETDQAPDGSDPAVNITNLAGAAPSAKDQEWIAYYARQTDVKPIADKPAWATDNKDDYDKYGVPKNMPSSSTDPAEQGWIDYYRDQGNLAKLQEMSEEEMYIDLGMGAKENSPNSPVKGSYFNSALSGLNFTGFGVDEDGDPQNFAILLRELADVFDTWDEDTKSYNPDIAKNSAKGLTSDELSEKAMRLMDKLKVAQEEFTSAHVELDARSSYLQANLSQLESQATNLNVEILEIEQVDLAAAITQLSWDQMCYSSALKIGTQLLSQSLIDYMR